MSGPRPTPIVLTARQRAALERIIRRQTSPQRLVRRALLILAMADGANNAEVACRFQHTRKVATAWRQRWVECAPALQAVEAEGEDDKTLDKVIEAILADAYRAGAPGKFFPEQIVQLIAVACEEPQASGRPVSHWTPRELADEVVKRGIVERISPRSVGRFLAQADLKPHRSRYWLNALPKDGPAFNAEVNTVCQVYAEAPALHAAGVHIVSTDEKSGIQALEPLHPTLPMKPGLVERREFEYTRHGTQCLIANFEVSTGAILAPTVGPTRTEADFVAHVEQTIATDPQGRWVFVVDQLNTHQSASLVEMVARHCELEVDLGEKGESGILESMQTRKEFLSDGSHRIHFVYTPKHTSWLNQVEWRPIRYTSIGEQRQQHRKYNGCASWPPALRQAVAGDAAIRPAGRAAMGDRVVGWEQAIRSRLLVYAPGTVVGECELGGQRNGRIAIFRSRALTPESGCIA